jgi:hypothetical protein
LSLGLISIFIMLAFVSYFLLEQKPVVWLPEGLGLLLLY